MDTQTFYRRVEITKCLLLSGILIILFLIWHKLPTLVTVNDLKTRKTALSQLPVVVVKDGRITLENEELKIKGQVTIENQPLEVVGQSRDPWSDTLDLSHE
ncbi:hypothetical protein L0128_06865 [candidate division KSB1 bacterium]|nr:hypothetical protein [candidate division KSB1 bacterium]